MALVLVCAGCSGDARRKEPPADGDAGAYGVFLGAGAEDISRLEGYETIVIDAQNFTPEQIAALKERGRTVYSYLNVGSIESFRPYYEAFKDCAAADYEHWDDEKWVDVSAPRWREFITQELAPAILAKGVDGLFVDNADVYWRLRSEAVFDALTDILRALKDMGAYVCINGGDVYVTEYLDRGGDPRAIADAVDQESVFSAIDWDGGSFCESAEEDRAYFQSYVETAAKHGLDVFLLEYTTDPALIARISDYCARNGFRYYAAGDLELSAP